MAAPLPQPDVDSAPFWEGCAKHQLRAQRCPACTRFRWPPMAFCPHCHAEGGEWVILPGTGAIAALVVVERAFDPAFSDAVPYAIAHIALDGTGDIVMLGNIETHAPDALAVGDRVVAGFVDVDGTTLPRFTPAGPK